MQGERALSWRCGSARLSWECGHGPALLPTQHLLLLTAPPPGAKPDACFVGDRDRERQRDRGRDRDRDREIERQRDRERERTKKS